MATKKTNPFADITLEEAVAKLKEISELNAVQEAQILAQQEQIDAFRLEIKDLTKEQEGWLITVPNPLYDGKTAGIKFNSGMAFLPADTTYPHLAGKKGNQTFIPDATKVAKFLQDHFGYTVKFYTYEEMKELKQALDNRNADRADAVKEAAELAKQDNMIKSLSRSHNISR